MNCFMCKGDLEDKNTTFMVELDNCITSLKMCHIKYVNNVAKYHIVMR